MRWRHPWQWGLALGVLCASPPSSGRPHRALSPRDITRALTRAQDAEGIVRIFTEQGAAFNDINLASAWNRLGKAKLSRKERRAFFNDHELTLLVLQAQTDRVVHTMSPRNLAGVSMGISRFGFEPAFVTMERIARVATRRIDDLSPQELASIAVAFGGVGVAAPALFDAIAATALIRLRTFNEQELTNVAWAFAKAGREHRPLFLAMSREVQLRLRHNASEFIPQGLANLAWAFASHGVHDEGEEVFRRIGHAAADRLDAFKAQELASLGWAFATVDVMSERLLRAVCLEAAARVNEFTTQGLANLVWACARSDGVAGSATRQDMIILFDTVAREILGGRRADGGTRPCRLGARP